MVQGPSVVAAINAFKPSERATSKPFRMPITDVFKGQRGGISVGGKLEGGAVKVGTPVRVMPSNEIGTVRSIEVDGATATLARAGDTADLTLAGGPFKFPSLIPLGSGCWFTNLALFVQGDSSSIAQSKCVPCGSD